MTRIEQRRAILWESELSPFALKVRALADYAGIVYRRLPAEGSRLENFRAVLRIKRAVRNGLAVRADGSTPLDEHPLVPYWIEEDASVHYDSSALAIHFDRRPTRQAPRAIPSDPSAGFAARWIDEAFDEIGLYLVHHRRWVLSATTTEVGRLLGREVSKLYPPGAAAVVARVFPRRQVRRLPYLFSVAPEGFTIDGLARGLVPPSREGFPPTHALLDLIWESWIDEVERRLGRSPYLLGRRFTVADASVYGQLAMNLRDPSARDAMRERAPRTFEWLGEIARGEHAGHPIERPTTGSGGNENPAAKISLDRDLAPLLAAVSAAFAPLMQQNERAWERAVADGATLFNEPAFDRHTALYDGELLGHPFRSVAKTFQVRVWRDLRREWNALDPAARQALAGLGIDGAALETTPN